MENTKQKTDVRKLIVFAAISVFAMGALYWQSASVNAYVGAGPTPTPAVKVKPTPKKAKFSEFPHDQKAHQVVCSTCHKFPSDNWNKVRTGDAAFPDVTEYPKHQSCVGCHKQQFFKGTPPKICSICHVNPSPNDSTRHPYPNPREIYDLSPKGKTAESDFVVGFPHDKHIEIVSQNRQETGVFVNASFTRPDRRMAGEESCSVCHKSYKPQGDSKDEYATPPPAKLGDGFWLKKGTFKSAPIGHTTCFTCHNADSGILPTPDTCSACHHLKPPQPTPDFDPKLATTMGIADKIMLDSWRRRDSSGKFQHEFFAHVDSSCSTCHNVLTMNTADPATKRVSISSCATCHATPTSDDGGALNYEVDQRKTNANFQCVKCHITFGKLAIPKSHSDAIAAAGGK
jgi:hypothetical protein